MGLEHAWHDLLYCENPDCQICGSGLDVCDVCGAYEGGLTTDCPGRQMTWEEIERVYKNGDLDFRNGEWVNEPNPTNQTWIKAKKYLDKIRENK
jgi:hypothetical protein